jgi:hypothetical protein
MWETPIYKLPDNHRKIVNIDVTTSCAPGLEPNEVLEKVIKFFKRHNIETILDFGAGTLRHTFPLLRNGFKVCAVEFKEQFQRPQGKKALKRAQRSPNFSALVFPDQFIKDKRSFDAVILSFVVPTMPLPGERKALLRLIKKKLKRDSVIFWMSQYGKYGNILKDSNKVSDGWYLNPKRAMHSFYTEFKNDDIDNMLKAIKYRRILSPSKRGNDQFRLYSKGIIKWP